MTISKKDKGFTNVLVISFAALFGVLALALGYAALNGNTDLRSKAAEEQTIYKQWEFNSQNADDVEGWKINKSYTLSSKFGNLQFTPGKDNSVVSLSQNKVSAKMPKGNKYLVFSIAVGSQGKVPPTPTFCPKPPVCAGSQVYSDTVNP